MTADKRILVIQKFPGKNTKERIILVRARNQGIIAQFHARISVKAKCLA